MFTTLSKRENAILGKILVLYVQNRDNRNGLKVKQFVLDV
jgi:hypothetical protein